MYLQGERVETAFMNQKKVGYGTKVEGIYRWNGQFINNFDHGGMYRKDERVGKAFINQKKVGHGTKVEGMEETSHNIAHNRM